MYSAARNNKMNNFFFPCLTPKIVSEVLGVSNVLYYKQF